MFAFIRKHWVAYLIGAAVAVALGFGVSYVLGVKWSLQRMFAQNGRRRMQRMPRSAMRWLATRAKTLTIHWMRTRRPTLNQPTPVHPQSSIQRPLLMLTL